MDEQQNSRSIELERELQNAIKAVVETLKKMRTEINPNSEDMYYVSSLLKFLSDEDVSILATAELIVNEYFLELTKKVVRRVGGNSYAQKKQKEPFIAIVDAAHRVFEYSGAPAGKDSLLYMV